MAQYGKTRALGQHFLRDPKVIDTIVEKTFELGKSSRALLEIGPGQGALTDKILAGLPGHFEKFVICERDRYLVEHWRAKSTPQIQVYESDFLDLPDEQYLEITPLTVVSNLPYSAGTAILTRLARFPEKIPAMILMFQAEVAQRLRASPQTKAWGSLSVWLQNRWDVEKLLSVPPGAFAPPPDVNSEVVTLIPRAQPRVHFTSEAAWEGLLKACFAHRRKMLRSGLPKTGPLRNALVQSGVDDTKRAEELTWEEWQKLCAGLPA